MPQLLQEPLANIKGALPPSQISSHPQASQVYEQQQQKTMARLVPFLVLLLILLPQTSLGQATSIDDRIAPTYLVNKKHARKLLVPTLDYDYGGANGKHDPKKGKPGNGGKNP